MCSYLRFSKTRHPLTYYSIFRNKAVSDGALSYYHDHFVSTRVSKFTYGYFCHPAFDPAAPDHLQRSHNVYVCASGVQRVKGFFDVILSKVCSFSSVVMCLIYSFMQNTQVSETKEFRKSYAYDRQSKSEFQGTTISITCYRGEVVTPQWEDIDTRKSLISKL